MNSVLIVDDEPGLLELLGSILEEAGYTVATALDGELGLTLARELHPDAIVLDYMLPALDGADVMRALQRDPALAATPVVMMSSLDQKLVARMCSGYSAYLRKPFRIEDVLDTVRGVLGS